MPRFIRIDMYKRAILSNQAQRFNWMNQTSSKYMQPVLSARNAFKQVTTFSSDWIRTLCDFFQNNHELWWFVSEVTTKQLSILKRKKVRVKDRFQTQTNAYPTLVMNSAFFRYALCSLAARIWIAILGAILNGNALFIRITHVSISASTARITSLITKRKAFLCPGI